MDSKDVLIAVGGGLAFVAVWIVLSLLFSAEPDYLLAILGGLIWFAGTLIVRSRIDRPQSA